MAIIFTKESEQTLILEPREALLRPFSFPNWTDIRMSMYFSSIGASGGNDTSIAEHVGYLAPADRFFFGIKNDDISLIPGTAGSLFIGSMAPQVTPGASRGCHAQSGAGSWQDADTDGNFRSSHVHTAIHGTTYIGGVNNGDNCNLSLTYPSPTGSTAYVGAFVQRIRITDRGLSTQQVLLNNNGSASVAGSAYTLGALRSYTQSLDLTANTRTYAWNDGASARDIPNNFYVRNPFFNNRLRISSLMIINATP